ncbi:hypothetical protein GUITHDRAFT_81101 [Guillardia theta CCMP2712]|uniref:Zinc transporter n=1 Tax=Guillardia theta (strain CCMP2712) TaxID=905079 RepID=L1IDC4_GUITC|nr:hypothetical protein GUITHDRAFT_81101 [Guillardia theta CCMP2712]EKX33810.1 hypothetical protein GUITHDRAFT_81101 [Guillardia theta CCMP2712]|eukprot:XP_005820790.1 hypothetical protein GUITHDRAFT_81101 [Guillardia theta CCMP2712]
MKEGNVALSFGLVLAAGMCTSLGAAVAFVVNVENKTFLAISLALSAGIMTYVSMVEIFTKSVVAFRFEQQLMTNCTRLKLLYSDEWGGVTRTKKKSLCLGDGTLTQPHFLSCSRQVERTHQEAFMPVCILAGLAVAIHNFPEGLATFDSSVGVTICVAIAIHNIPEGICVAMPIYHATKSRLKGFIWATISGLSEPLGAVVGYLAVKDNINNVSYGAMFALVAGMMVFISLAELLPSAYRHDVNHAIVTSSWVLGMLIMALSLVAFNL